MNACGTAVLDPVDKLFETHLVPQLQRFSALIERYNPIPRIANKSELEIGLKLLATEFSAALFRQEQIECGHDPVFSSPILSPCRFHELLDLPQIQVRLPCFAENPSDARRSGLGHLHENAFVLV